MQNKLLLPKSYGLDKVLKKVETLKKDYKEVLYWFDDVKNIYYITYNERSQK